MLRVNCAFFVNFHPKDGPVLSHQYPPETITESDFDELNNYVTPKSDLCGQVSWLCRGPYLYVYSCNELIDKQYHRNKLIFTFGLQLIVDVVIGSGPLGMPGTPGWLNSVEVPPPSSSSTSREAPNSHIPSRQQSSSHLTPGSAAAGGQRGSAAGGSSSLSPQDGQQSGMLSAGTEGAAMLISPASVTGIPWRSSPLIDSASSTQWASARYAARSAFGSLPGRYPQGDSALPRSHATGHSSAPNSYADSVLLANLIGDLGAGVPTVEDFIDSPELRKYELLVQKICAELVTAEHSCKYVSLQSPTPPTMWDLDAASPAVANAGLAGTASDGALSTPCFPHVASSNYFDEWEAAGGSFTGSDFGRGTHHGRVPSYGGSDTIGTPPPEWSEKTSFSSTLGGTINNINSTKLVPPARRGAKRDSANSAGRGPILDVSFTQRGLQGSSDSTQGGDRPNAASGSMLRGLEQRASLPPDTLASIYPSFAPLEEVVKSIFTGLTPEMSGGGGRSRGTHVVHLTPHHIIPIEAVKSRKARQLPEVELHDVPVRLCPLRAKRDGADIDMGLVDLAAAIDGTSNVAAVAKAVRMPPEIALVGVAHLVHYKYAALTDRFDMQNMYVFTTEFGPLIVAQSVGSPLLDLLVDFVDDIGRAAEGAAAGLTQDQPGGTAGWPTGGGTQSGPFALSSDDIPGNYRGALGTPTGGTHWTGAYVGSNSGHFHHLSGEDLVGSLPYGQTIPTPTFTPVMRADSRLVDEVVMTSYQNRQELLRSACIWVLTQFQYTTVAEVAEAIKRSAWASLFSHPMMLQRLVLFAVAKGFLSRIYEWVNDSRLNRRSRRHSNSHHGVKGEIPSPPSSATLDAPHGKHSSQMSDASVVSSATTSAATSLTATPVGKDQAESSVTSDPAGTAITPLASVPRGDTTSSGGETWVTIDAVEITMGLRRKQVVQRMQDLRLML